MPVFGSVGGRRLVMVEVEDSVCGGEGGGSCDSNHITLCGLLEQNPASSL